MAKKSLSKSTVSVTSISDLPNKPLITATALKGKFDAYAAGDKPYINALVDELQDSASAATAGSYGIGHDSANILADNVGDALEELYAREGTLDGQNVKLTGNQTIAGIKTFSSSPIVPTPTTDMQSSTKKYVDDVDTLQKGYIDGLDGQNVKLSGNQSIADIKTFTSSPIVPTPTTNMQASTKKYADDGLALKANDNVVVKITGTQSIDGVKTFTSSPVVPTPTTPTQAVTKGYVDTLDGANVKLTGTQTISGVKTFSSSPVVPEPTSASQATTKNYVDDAIEDHTLGTPTRSASQLGYIDIMSLPSDSKPGCVRGKFKGITLYNYLKNVITAGAYTATTNWATVNGALTVSSGNLRNTGGGANTNIQTVQSTTEVARITDTHALNTSVRVNDAVCTSIKVYINGTTGGTAKLVLTINTPTNGAFNEIKVKDTLPADATGNVKWIIESNYADNATQSGKTLDISGAYGAMANNLTSLGQTTLTADEMAILCRNGYFEGFGHGELDVKTVGKNLFDGLLEPGWIDTSGNNFVSTADIRGKNYYRVDEGESYGFKCFNASKVATTDRIDLYEYDINKVFIKRTVDKDGFLVSLDSRTSFIRITLTTNTNLTLLVAIYKNEIPSIYEPFKNSILSVNDKTLKRVPNGVQDVYDTETGVLTQNVVNDAYTLASANITSVANGTNVQYATIPLSNFVGIKTQVTSVIDGGIIFGTYKESAVLDTAGDTYNFVTDGTNLYVQVPLGTWVDLAATRTALTSTVITKVVYALATPITTTYNKDLLSFESGTIYQDGLTPLQLDFTTPLNTASTIADQSLLNEHLEKRIERVDGVWINYTPTLTFTTGTPSTITTIARYTTVGNTCHFNINISSADGNGATALKISLPITPKDNNAVINMNGQEKVNTTWTNPLAYIDDDDTNGIQFRAFSTATDNVAFEINITGSYEVAI